jgi:hypothetical protein
MSILFKLALFEVKNIHSSIEKRAELLDFRYNVLKTLQPKMLKVAFDTRYINQETETNPRRNLQYFHRNEPYITADMSGKIKTFFKLKTVVDELKEDFHRDHDWHDSYCRVLSASLDRTLRADQKDMNFFAPQMEYLNELLYLRYRLKDDDINKLGEVDLRNIILNRDEKLLYKNIYANYDKSNKSIVKDNNDPLIEKLMGNVKATTENKDIERTISITVRDKINEDIKKES